MWKGSRHRKPRGDSPQAYNAHIVCEENNRKKKGGGMACLAKEFKDFCLFLKWNFRYTVKAQQWHQGDLKVRRGDMGLARERKR